MKNNIKPFILTIAVIFQTLTCSYGQSYTLEPGDSIKAELEFDQQFDYDILQQNNLPDTLWLSWQRVDTILPPEWVALVCDNFACANHLIAGGNMSPVMPGEYGLLSIHITPHTNAGTAIIRYAVWETSNPSVKDTLTWIFSAGLTGIDGQGIEENSIVLSNHQLIVQNKTGDPEEITILDLQGRIMFRERRTSLSSTIDISHLTSGIFLVDLRSEKSHFTAKMFLQ